MSSFMGVTLSQLDAPFWLAEKNERISFKFDPTFYLFDKRLKFIPYKIRCFFISASSLLLLILLGVSQKCGTSPFRIYSYGSLLRLSLKALGDVRQQSHK